MFLLATTTLISFSASGQTVATALKPSQTLDCSVAAACMPKSDAVRYTANHSPTPLCSALQDADLQRLSLPMALDHALCRSPVLRQAMLSIAEQQAGVDLANSSFRPRVNANVGLNASRVAPIANTIGYSLENLSGSVGLSWVLFDFGLRSANVAQTQAQLAAAIASLDSSQLQSTNDTLRLYLDALTAWLRQSSLREAEEVAQQSAHAANAKYDAQVGSLAEKLQAQTALAQTTLERVRANGQWETARAALAIHMGFGVSQSIALPEVEQAVPFVSQILGTDQLLENLRTQHPRMLALQAEHTALKRRGESIAADGKGSVSASANVQTSRAFASGAGFERSANAALVATIPLFNGVEQNARLAQNSAQTDAKLAQIDSARRELETELLRQALAVQTEQQTQIAARVLLDSANQSYQVASGRYKAGVGTVVELLTAQAALGAAKFALNQSLANLATASMRLLAASGRVQLKS